MRKQIGTSRSSITEPSAPISIPWPMTCSTNVTPVCQCVSPEAERTLTSGSWLAECTYLSTWYRWSYSNLCRTSSTVVAASTAALS